MSKIRVSFHSSLGAAMSRFVDFKKMEGYDYGKRAERLACFDRFLVEEKYTENILTESIIQKYLEAYSHLQPGSRVSRLSAPRVFSKYLHMFKPESHVFGPTPFPVPTRNRFYLYSRSDVLRLLEAARIPRRGDQAFARGLPSLIGLLYTTGLRIAEALKLDVEDIDFKEDTLLVRKGKFAKDRYVALHPSVSMRLAEWLRVREGLVPDKSDSPLFADSTGSRLKYARVRARFHNLVVASGVGGDRPFKPRIHDLRHTFACNCVDRWRRDGRDVNAKLPILATALGHVNIRASQKYLHVTAADLRSAADRFHKKIFQTTSNGE